MPKRRARCRNAELVFAVMQAEGRPLSAYQILESLRPQGVKAATTVYRALERLRADRRIHRIESIKAYTTCCRPDHAETPVFAICDACGAVTEHLDAALLRSVAALTDGTGFQPETSVIEIRGLCGDCRLDAAPD